MLRRTHVQPFLEERGGALEVVFLRDADGRVVRFLDRLCRLVRKLEGRPRRTVAEALRRQEPRVRDVRRLAGVSKVLLDASRFRAPEGAERAPRIREAVFRARGGRWPPTPVDLDEPYLAAAADLGLPAEEVKNLLYADAPEAQRLVRPPALDGSALLDRYNLELARAVLLDATKVVVQARGGWKSIFRAVKLARLMYRIERRGRRTYRVELTGPAAEFVAHPQRYGHRLAMVVPSLTRAPHWSLEAEIVRGERHLPFLLDGRAPLGPSRKGARYDSSWERSLAQDFREKLGDEREGWTLVREDAPLSVAGQVFLPDFTLRHRDGREALVEIMGFWTPEYLADKVRKIRAAGLENLVLVVYRGLAAGPVEAAAEGPVLWFVNKPRIGEVLAAAERVAAPPDSHPPSNTSRTR